MSVAQVWVTNPELKKFKRIVRQIVQKLIKLTRLRKCHFDIYLVDNHFMNTNVLTLQAPKRFPRPDIKKTYLGEIYLNPNYIKRHGESLRKMLIHGFLHLLGYDHKKRTARIKMEKKEQFLLRKLVISK